MPPRRYLAMSARFHFQRASDSDESDGMRCLCCKELYDVEDGGTCKECYQTANETLSELNGKVEKLSSKLSFLTMPTPVFNSDSVDILFFPADEPGASPIPVNEIILVTRSHIFKAMLKSGMSECQSGAIKISDVSYHTLRTFVNYLYTAEAHLNDEMAFKLLVLGEKYQVEHLKTYCEKYLVHEVNWENAIANYTFACQYNCKDLQSESLGTIFDNMNRFTKHEDYAMLVNRNPRLVVEIYEAYVVNQSSVIPLGYRNRANEASEVNFKLG